MKNYVGLSIVVLSLGLAACSQNAERAAQISSSLEANKTSESYLAWEGSEFNPEKLFAEWNRKLIMKEIEVSGVCPEFENLQAQDLVNFENEIRSEANVALLDSCRGALITKLDEYWAANKPVNTKLSAKSRSGQFSFPDNVQFKNLDNGYFGYSGDVGTKEVVLTFDDGPHNHYTDDILASMAQVNAKAIFFMTGTNVNRYPDIVQKIADQGHAVGGHSMSHKCLAANTRCKNNNGGRMFSVEEAMKDIRGTFQAIFKAVGFVDPFFRFPYGESSPELKKQLQSNQVGEFYWSVDSNDWRTYDKNGQPWTGSRMIEEVMGQLNNSSKKRGMLLFHDIQKKTAEALPTLLSRLYYDGYSVVLLKAENTRFMTNPKILRTGSEHLIP